MIRVTLHIIKDLKQARGEYDACIIGSGAGGGVLAYRLSEAGKTVAVLEKGGHYPIEWIEGTTKEEGTTEEKRPTEEELTKLWKSGGEQLSRNYSVNIAQAECVGGGTVINWGVCFETPEPVLNYWREIFGFPYSQGEMAGAFQAVRDMIQITRVENAGGVHQVVKKGVQALGYRGDWMERNSVEGVKQSMLVSYLGKANPERVHVFPDCEVQEFILRKRRAAGVRATYTNPTNSRQERVEIRSKIVVLAAGAIASSGLLLRNRLDRNRQVGRHLSIHPGAGVMGEFGDEINMNMRLPMAYYCDEFNVRETGRPGFMIESTIIPPYQFGANVTRFGDAHADIMRRYAHMALAGVLVHDEPSGTVSLNWRDEPVIDYALSAMDQQKMIIGLEEASRILLAAGAKRVILPHFSYLELRRMADIQLIRRRGMGAGTLGMATPHPQGGNRMGRNGAYCVVNEHCEMFDVPRLFVCDASVFPTSVGVNPQVTVMAIAELTAQYINSEYA